MCHWCQRKMIMAGGFPHLLSDHLEQKAGGHNRLIWRQGKGQWITGDAVLAEAANLAGDPPKTNGRPKVIAGIEDLCGQCTAAARVAGSVESMLIKRISRRAAYAEPLPKLSLEYMPPVASIASMTDTEAWHAVCFMRWPKTGGSPICPRCRSSKVYTHRMRRRFVCGTCKHQFTPLSGTMFSNHKKPYREFLAALAYEGPTHSSGVMGLKTAIDMRRRKIANGAA